MIQVKTLILHIGAWKTGTTSIQTFLDRNFARLSENSILYPKSTRDDGAKLASAHHQLCALLKEADGLVTKPLADTLGEISKELRTSGCETLLLSSETFMGLIRPEILRRYFSAETVIIVVSLRHQAEFLNAMYYTEVCHLKVIDLPMEYLSGLDRRKLNYLQALDRWAKVWPGTVIKPSLFDPGTPARAFPVQHFLNQIGLSWRLSEADNVVEHRTLPAQATMVLRQLAQSGLSDYEFFRIFQLFHHHRDFFAPISSCYAPQVMRKIEADYLEANARLAATYLPDGSPGFARLDLPDAAEWSAAMMPIENIFAAFVRRIASTAAAAPFT